MHPIQKFLMFIFFVGWFLAVAGVIAGRIKNRDKW